VSRIEHVSEQKNANVTDAKRAALAAWLNEWRRERERSDERYEAARQRFEIAHRRLLELAHRG
jgi:hypothetical protein